MAQGAGLALAAAAAPAAVEAQSAQAERISAAGAAAIWERFVEALGPLARNALGDASEGAGLHELEGIRCLTRLLSLGFDRFLEHADPSHPSFYDLQTPVRKYLGDNPDQTYRAAAIDGRGRYRVRGTVAGAAGIEVGVYAGVFQAGGAKRRLVASIDDRTLRTGEDGSFELTLGPGLGEENHLSLAPDAHSLLIRTYFWDRTLRLAHAQPTIERLDVAGPPPPLSSDALMRGLLGAVAFVDGSLAWWNTFQGTKTGDNQLIVMPDDGTVQTPSLVRYLNARVVLAPDEALLLEFAPKDEPDYWSWVLQNEFGETPDWRHRPVVLNNRELRRDAAGGVKIVVAHGDPGVPNWMDMAGHERMLLSLRWRGESALPAVATRVVKRDELAM
jgi:hypothetical protein